MIIEKSNDHKHVIAGGYFGDDDGDRFRTRRMQVDVCSSLLL